MLPGIAPSAAAHGMLGRNRSSGETGQHPLDFFLTFQVKCAGGGSHKAVGLLQHHQGPGLTGAGGQGRALHSVPLAQGDHFSAIQFHR